MAFGRHPASGQHAFAHVFIHRVLGHFIECFVIPIALKNGYRSVCVSKVSIAVWRAKYRNLCTQRRQTVHRSIIAFQHICITDLPLTVVNNTKFQSANTGALKGKQTLTVFHVLIDGPSLCAAHHCEHQCDICDRACHRAGGVQCVRQRIDAVCG